MDRDLLIREWKHEQEIAHIHGWDFSHIDGRHFMDEERSWSYPELVAKYRADSKKLLDIDTGGGEMLLSFGHPHENTAATEAYPPNVQLCEETLLPLGIDFREANGEGPLPFADESMDLITNRHGSYCAKEYFRVLKKGGLFITQQVGRYNERELIDLITPGVSGSFTGNDLASAKEEFIRAGFRILEEGESFRPVEFYDIGALVWFACVLPWEFVGFSVDTHLGQLLKAQEMLEKDGAVRGTTHRFMLVAQKPE